MIHDLERIQARPQAHSDDDCLDQFEHTRSIFLHLRREKEYIAFQWLQFHHFSAQLFVLIE